MPVYRSRHLDHIVGLPRQVESTLDIEQQIPFEEIVQHREPLVFCYVSHSHAEVETSYILKIPRISLMHAYRVVPPHRWVTVPSQRQTASIMQHFLFINQLVFCDPRVQCSSSLSFQEPRISFCVIVLS